MGQERRGPRAEVELLQIIPTILSKTSSKLCGALSEWKSPHLTCLSAISPSEKQQGGVDHAWQD